MTIATQMTTQQATHVTKIIHSAHVATGIFIKNATDNTRPHTCPDYRPVVHHYYKASTGELMYQRIGGIGRKTQWLDAKGNALFDPEFDWMKPDIEPISKFPDWQIH